MNRQILDRFDALAQVVHRVRPPTLLDGVPAAAGRPEADAGLAAACPPTPAAAAGRAMPPVRRPLLSGRRLLSAALLVGLLAALLVALARFR